MKIGEVLIKADNAVEHIQDDKKYVIAGVQSYGKGVVNRRTVKGFDLAMKKYKIIEKNQLMWCKVDTKNGAFGITMDENIGSLASSNMALFNIDTTKAKPSFIQLLFTMPPFYEYINSLSSGTTNRKYIKPNDFLDIVEIPDFNLKEQEDFMKNYEVFNIDYSNFNQEILQQENYVQKLRQAILQEAVQGKLVPQDPKDEPASVLLEKIKAEKEQLIKDKKIKKEKPLPPIPQSEIPYDLPQGWEWCRFIETTKVVEYGTSHKASEINIGVPVLRMNNIQNGKIDYLKLKYVNKDIKDLPRLYLRNKDLIFNRTNSYELVGKTGIFELENNSFTLASYLIRISLFNEYIEAFYVNYYCNSTVFRETQIEPQIIQQCGQANFSGSKLKNTIVPLPPIAEQKRIVAKVGELMKLCDELEEQIIQSKTHSEQLMQSILHEVFKSEV